MGKTIQSHSTDIVDGIKTTNKDFSNFNYFLGGIDVTDQNLDQFDPYIQGVSRIFWHKLPPFMGKAVGETKNNCFKTYVETGFTRVDGIGDLSVDFVDFEGGFAGQKFSNVSLARDDTDAVTISVYEGTGSPIREYIDTWITGTRDPRSGLAHYHGALAKSVTEEKDSSGTKNVYGEKNHTGEIVYITMDPTGKRLEYACLFAHCFPTKVSKNHLNFEKGNRDNVLMDLEFRTTKYESPAINDVGYWYLRTNEIKASYLDFVPTMTVPAKNGVEGGATK